MMIAMSPKTRWRIVAALALAAVVGWKWHAALPRSATVGGAGMQRSASAAPTPRRKLGNLAFTPCTLAPQSGAAGVEAQCGTLSVAENPALPNARKIALHVAWVPADDNGQTPPDPVFMLAGGPGQAATESYPQIAPAFREVLKKCRLADSPPSPKQGELWLGSPSLLKRKEFVGSIDEWHDARDGRYLR